MSKDYRLDSFEILEMTDPIVPPVSPDQSLLSEDQPSIPAPLTRPRVHSRPKVSLDPRIDYSEFNIHIVAWNIASTIPSSHDIESLFLPQEGVMMVSNLYDNSDIIVIGLQEAYQSVHDAVQSSVPLVGKDPLAEAFGDFLNQKGFARLSSSRLLGILTLVFIKRPLLCYIHGTDSCTTRTGFKGLLGNKGASSIRFSLGDVGLCFTNLHLVPHMENNEKRVNELRDIFEEQIFYGNQTDLKLLDHDILILFGDLNFRLEGKSFEDIEQMLSTSKGSELLELDQLRVQQVKSDEDCISNLNKFVEMPISFPPSYKYEPGSDVFDKRRPPAWCDRILWNTHERRLPQLTDPEPRLIIKYEYYGLHMQPRISDHKAVCAGFKVSVNLSGFTPRIIFHVMMEWIAGKQGTIAFEVVPGTEVSTWDWIGLYPANFSSVERDYVYWIYAASRSKLENGKMFSRVLAPAQVPAEGGRYVMVYKSSVHNCVLGMSPIFPIRSTTTIN